MFIIYLHKILKELLIFCRLNFLKKKQDQVLYFIL